MKTGDAFNIAQGMPALLKYMKAYFTDDQRSYYYACVQHGMMYGKTKPEAEATERMCFERMNNALHAGTDVARRELFEIQTAYAESAKSREQYIQYLQGNGVEIGSGGWPMVPWAIQVELSKDTYATYNSGNVPEIPVQWHSDNPSLPFKDNTMDWCASSHLIEDFEFRAWPGLLSEWVRIIKPGGHLVILVPDRDLWKKALREGQPPNCAHRHESKPGELTGLAPQLGLKVIRDSLAGDRYSILFIGQKL